jgi:hypothetical protein
VTSLEKRVVGFWRLWGDGYAMSTRCSSCGEVKHCRGKRRAYMLCIDCFDQKPPKGYGG